MKPSGQGISRPSVRVITSRPAARQWEAVAAAPALAVVVISLSITFILPSETSSSWIGSYEDQATRAMISGDYGTARICFERLMQHAPTNHNYREGLELTLRMGHATDTRTDSNHAGD